MDTLDNLKEKYARKTGKVDGYNASHLSRVIHKRIHLHTRESMKYFWASLVLQIIVYALYTHVIVRFINDPFTIVYGLVGIAAFLPFTFVLLRKFKRIATLNFNGNESASVRDCIVKQKDALHAFFRFKRRYELVLIPLSTMLGTLLVFKIYVPGGPLNSVNGVIITISIALLSCFAAIRKENRKSFREPIAELDKLLREFNEQ